MARAAKPTTATAAAFICTLALAGTAASAAPAHTGPAHAGPAATGPAPTGQGLHTWASNVLARVNPKYLVCHPSKWPGANPVYPFSFMLTTKYQNTSNPNIRAAVKSIQQVIDYRNWGDQLTSPHPVFVTVDGKYGPKTAAAIKKFQKATGIFVDGKVGKQTWAMLAAHCGSD